MLSGSLKRNSKHALKQCIRPVTTSTYFDMQKDYTGKSVMEVGVNGVAALRIPQINKGAAFTLEERKKLHLSGLLPPTVKTMEQQVERCYSTYSEIPNSIEKYQYLRHLQERNEHLYYAFLAKHLSEVMPIIYTPTVGEACRKYSYMFNFPRGLSFSVENIDQADQAVHEYHLQDIRMIVATDSSAILGIGDQGYGGMGIPIGKLALYTAAGGVSPFQTCPVALDVGTNREDLLQDPMYLGVKMGRLSGAPYMELVEKFVAAVKRNWPNAIIQWEDLSKDVAFEVLHRFRDEISSFNDDIQGTGAVTMAGVIAACKKTGQKLSDQMIVISGAGAGGAGVAWVLREGMIREGLTPEEARARVMVLDSTGLLFHGRKGMEDYKLDSAQTPELAKSFVPDGGIPNLLQTIVGSKCTCLIGLSGVPGQFTEEIVKAVAANTDIPIIMPLSNPNASVEAFPEDIVKWTNNKALIACGSPFDDVETSDGKKVPIGQGNNAFVFPGLGAGAIVAGASKITDNMVMEGGYAVADYCCHYWPQPGRLYPPVSEMRKVGKEVAKRVAIQAVKDGVATNVPDTSMDQIVRQVEGAFWAPVYPKVIPQRLGKPSN